MTDRNNSGNSLSANPWPEIVQKIRARTPARLLAGRSGAAYRTGTQLDLREAHAGARDAVRAELDLQAAFEPDFLEQWKPFELHTRAVSKQEYLLRPDLGRQFDETSRTELAQRGTPNCDFQIIIGDGLSVSAVTAQVPTLLPLLIAGARERGWTVGQPFVVHHCRVGILNEIGELLTPQVVVLLIGERPGLATAESLSAYMAYRPREKHSDADRNLISNIHARGVDPNQAAARILNRTAQMMKTGNSGYSLKESPPTLAQE
ncbi:MAG: ethanolamine ammonia-lyase subunit EutC [Terriglobales bacterium]